MAISGATVWQIRTGGASTNGGGYHSGGGGTDYSQQNAAQYALTGVASSGAGDTVLSASAAADMVGNIAQCTGGTNAVTGFYEVLSVSVGVSITLSKNNSGTSIASGIMAAGVINVGGALSDLPDGDSGYQGGNTIYWVGGTYSRTTTRTMTADGSATAGNINCVGVPSGGPQTDTDIIESSQPVLTSATNSIALITLNGANFWMFRNLKFTHTAAIRGAGIVNATAGSNAPTIRNCVFDGCLSAVIGGGTTAVGFVGFACIATTIRNCTSSGLSIATGGGTFFQVIVDGCDISACAGQGISLSGGFLGGLYVKRTIIHGVTGASGHGIEVGTSTQSPGGFVSLDQVVLEGNAQSGIRFDYTTGRHLVVEMNNVIVYNNGAYGMSCATAGIMDGNWPVITGCAFGVNTPGAKQNVRTGDGEISLSADPFANKSGGDYSLNSSAGGGALLRSLGLPGWIGVLGSSTATFPNVGASDPQATAAAGGHILGSF